jgi:hypothetical protein
MPYRFEPKDLDRTDETRSHSRPDDAAARAFERWLDGIEDVRAREIGGETSEAIYELAVDVLNPLDVSPTEATAVPLAYPDRVPPNVGLFLSAAYNRSDEDVIVFDAEYRTTPRRLGFRLPAEKTLLLDEPVHSTMGVGARGLVINRTDVEQYFGYSADGVFVNCGTCLTLGFETTRATVDLGTVRGQSGVTGEERAVAVDDAGGVSGSFVGDDLSTALETYLDELDALVTGDVGSVRRRLDDLDGPPADVVVGELVDRIER